MLPFERDVKFFVENHPGEFGRPIGAEGRVAGLRRILTPETCGLLEEKGWGISLATIGKTKEDDEATGKLIQEINRRNPGLPVVLWVVLPDDQGYWTNDFNVWETRRRVEDLDGLINYFDLNITGYGFDIEPNIKDVRMMSGGLVSKMMVALRVRSEIARQNRSGYSGADDFAELIGEIRARGVLTEAYTVPAPLDGLLGLMRPKGVNAEFAMTYTSAAPKMAQRQLLRSGMARNVFPAFGNISSTGVNAGRDLGGVEVLHGESELKRDLRDVAKIRWSKLNRFRVFALTGQEVVRWTDEGLTEALSI